MARRRLAPRSWLIERNIVEARKKMNLSNWEETSPDAQDVMIGKASTKQRAEACRLYNIVRFTGERR
jgi:hypothetical protein